MTKIIAFIKAFQPLIIAVLIGLGILLFVKQSYWKGVLAQAKTEFAEKEKAFDIKYNLLDEKQKAAVAKADEKAKEAALLEKKNKILQDEIDKWKEINKKWSDLVAKMPADEVVINTQTYLVLTTVDIWKNQSGLQFTLLAAKTNLLKLGEWSVAYTKTIPDYELLVKGKDAVIDKKNGEIADLNVALGSCNEKVVDLFNLKNNYDDLLSKYNKANRWLNFSLKGNVVLFIVGGILLLLK